MTLRTQQSDYIFLARDREAIALRKLQNMPWAVEQSLRADLRHALWVFPLVAVFVVGIAAVVPG